MPREIGKVMKLNSSNDGHLLPKRAKNWNSLQEKQGISISEGLMEVKSSQANTCQKCSEVASLTVGHRGGPADLLASLPAPLIIVL